MFYLLFFNLLLTYFLFRKLPPQGRKSTKLILSQRIIEKKIKHHIIFNFSSNHLLIMLFSSATIKFSFHERLYLKKRKKKKKNEKKRKKKEKTFKSYCHSCLYYQSHIRLRKQVVKPLGGSLEPVYTYISSIPWKQLIARR